MSSPRKPDPGGGPAEKTTAELLREFQESVARDKAQGQAFDIFGQAGRQPSTEAELRANIEQIELTRPLNAEERQIRRELDEQRAIRDKRLWGIKLANKKKKANQKAG